MPYGALGARAPPRPEKKVLGPNLQGKIISAPLRQSKIPIVENIFAGRGGIWRVGVVNLAFSRKKVHPVELFLATPMSSFVRTLHGENHLLAF